MIAKQRLYLNAAKSALVAAGHPDAAQLYCTPGDQIPDSAAERFGIVDGELQEGEMLEGTAVYDPRKESSPRENKEDRGGENKGGASNPDKTGDGTPNKSVSDGGAESPAGHASATTSLADDLTRLKGVGDAIAATFASAGVRTFASIAAIDPNSPPPIDGLPRGFKWADVVQSAQDMVAKRDEAARGDQAAA